MAKTDYKKKAGTAVKQTASFAKSNGKDLLLLGGIAVAAYLLIRTAKNTSDKVTDLIPDVGSDPGAGGGGVVSGGNTVPQSGNHTITKNQAATRAAGLFQAMVPWDGTDEERIFDLLRGLTPDDYVLISQEFGTPRYDGFGEAFFPFPKHNLSNWLQSELTNEEFQKLKTEILPGVF